MKADEIWTIQQEAEKLEERFKGVNQAEFARKYEVPGGPSMVNQHIKARRPMSMDAALAYMKGFGVQLHEISPRLAQQMYKALRELDPKKEFLDALNIQAADPKAFESTEAKTRRAEEEQLLAAFRNLPSSERRDLVRDVTTRAEQLEEMVSRYLQERSEGAPSTPASTDTAPPREEPWNGLERRQSNVPVMVDRRRESYLPRHRERRTK